MVTAEQLVHKFLEKAQIHKPNMTAHQLHAYVIGLLADELAWAFNNDDTVARNVRQLLHKLDPRKPPKAKPITASQDSANNGTQHPASKITSNKEFPEDSSSSKSSKIGTDISKNLSYQSLELFLNKYPKTVIKDFRDQKNGFFWIFVAAKAYDDDSQLFQWLRNNKFEYSEIEKAWYYPII